MLQHLARVGGLQEHAMIRRVSLIPPKGNLGPGEGEGGVWCGAVYTDNLNISLLTQCVTEVH